MKKDFKPIKNIILLIASALSLVAVTFAWYSLSKNVGNFSIESNVSGTTLAVQYFQSDDGSNYTNLDGDIAMKDMVEGKKCYYKMNVKTFRSIPVKLVMNFEDLKSDNITSHVYFDYKVVCNADESVISSANGLKMSDYVSDSVFANDLSGYQSGGKNDFTVYYDVYVKADGAALTGSSELGIVRLSGQQV